MNKVGPKLCLIAASAIICVGWTLIYSTRSVLMLYFIRFLFGVSMGITFTVAPVYVAEISSPDVRGALSTGFETMLYLGHVFEFCVGPLVSYEVLALASVTIPIVFLLGSYWMKESPYYLLKIDRYDKAGETLSSLAGIDSLTEVELQLERIRENIATNARGSVKDLLESSVNRRCLFIVVVLAVVQRLSGMSAVVAYAAFIFPSTLGGLSSAQYTIAFGVVTLLFTLISAYLMDRTGRRVLTIASCFGSFIVDFLTGLYFFLTVNSPNANFSWIPFFTISAYASFYSIGMGPIVTTAQGELFPQNVKGLSSSIVTIIHAATGSLVTKLFQIVSDTFGVYVSFWIFSINCFLGTIFVYFMLPETKNKTLLEVQRSM